DEAGIRRFYRYRDFAHFVEAYVAVLGCLRDGDDFALITRELGEEAARQRVRYLEVTFTPAGRVLRTGISWDDLFGGIVAGAEAARRAHGVEMRFIPDSPRLVRPGQEPAVAELTAEWAVSGRDRGVVALGLGGTEVGNPPELFAEVFRWAKARGLRSWPHAGETVGPEGVWGALRALDADRLAHGIRAAEDP